MTVPIPRDVTGVNEAWVRLALAEWSDRRCGALLERSVIGADRGYTGAVVRFRFDDLDLVAKLPNQTAFERGARELSFLREFDQPLPLATPTLIGGAADSTRERVVLLLSREEGTPGDVLAEPAPGQLDIMLQDLAALHATYWNTAPEYDWLPRWGEGTRGAAAPHRRRIRRYCARSPMFLDHHGGAPFLPRLIERVADTLEADLTTVAALPVTLIHADVHLDNIIRRADGGIVWLDWQSASRGPGLYDLTRLLSETVPADGAPSAGEWLDRYLAGLGAAVPPPEIESTRAAWPAMQRCVFAGFISGYAGRRPDTMTERENMMVARSAGENGLAALVAAGSEMETGTGTE